MNAVLRVDLKFRVGSVVLCYDFVDLAVAVPLFRRVIFGQVHGDRDVFVRQRQVRRLIFFVIGIRNENRGETVKRYFAVGFRVLDFRRISRLFRALWSSWCFIVQVPARAADTCRWPSKQGRPTFPT